MRRWKSAVFAAISIAFVAIACGLQDGGTLVGEGTDGSKGDGTFGDGSEGDGSGGDGSSSADSGDATSDAGIDAGPAVTYLCAATAGQVAHCATDCPLTPFECPSLSACVGDCMGMCPGTGFFCDACFADSGPAVARCEPPDAAAFAECLTGFNRCSCNNESDCPGNNQTCNGSGCFECGEPDAANVDNNTTCKAGMNGHKCTSDAMYVKCK